MKKIVSCTIATALAATNLTTVSAEVVRATTKTDDSINMKEDINNSVNVTVEDTDKIENVNGSISGNIENSDNASETTDNSTDEGNESSEESNKGDELEEGGNTSSVVQDSESNNDKQEIDNNEEVFNDEKESVDDLSSTNSDNIQEKESVEAENIKSLGKLEFDINFPMPILSLDSIDIIINKDNKKIAQISNITELQGTLDNGITYTIEKLNSNKAALEDGQEVTYNS
ncbi:hypothetical protein ABFP60_17155 [Clostridioides difficile]